jgi:hypothetical protein
MTDTVRKLMLPRLAIVAALLPAALFAQDELIDEEIVPIKRYTVEIVVFSYLEDVSVGTEVFPPDQVSPPMDDIEEIVVKERTRRHPDAIGLEPVLLTEEDFTMHNVIEQFELLDAYETVLHVGWIQAGFPQDDTEPMELSRFGVPPAGLEGSFTLYLGRYLHLVVDLAMDAPVEEEEFVAEIEPYYYFGDSRLQFTPQIEAEEGPVRYRIQENRIIKNAEVRYFDHPKFGVVAKVTRLEEPEEEAEEESAVQDLPAQ